jgi:hypothetical protein
MPFISSRIFVAGGTKKLMSLLNEEHVRFIGTNWTTIRIGVLCALQDNSGANVTGRLGIGVCSGQTNPLGSTNTTNFVGFRHIVGVPTQTFTANAGDAYFTNASFFSLLRQGNTDTPVGLSTTTLNIVSTAPGNGALQRRSLIMLDISKTTGAVQPFYTATNQFNADYTVGDMIACMEYSAAFQTPAFRGITLTASTSQTPGFSQVAGLYDCLDIHWSGTAQALEIYGLGVIRKS